MSALLRGDTLRRAEGDRCPGAAVAAAVASLLGHGHRCLSHGGWRGDPRQCPRGARGSGGHGKADRFLSPPPGAPARRESPRSSRMGRQCGQPHAHRRGVVDGRRDRPSPDMTESLTPHALIERFLDHVDRGEWISPPDFYAPDAVVEQPFAKPPPIRLEGRDTIRAHFASAARAPLRLRVIDRRILDTSDPDVIVAEFDYDGEAT